MGRLVDPVPVGGTAYTKNGDQSDNAALERIAKYVPGEVIAAYLGITSLVESGTKSETGGRTLGLLLALLVGLVFTPLYLNRLAEEGKPKRLHLAIGTASFVMWSYATKGVWADIGVHNSLVGGIAIIIFSLATGLMAPTEGSK